MSNTKTLRSLAKRIKVTGRGKIVHHRSGTSHNMASKSRKRKRFLSRPAVMSEPLTRKTRLLIAKM